MIYDPYDYAYNNDYYNGEVQQPIIQYDHISPIPPNSIRQNIDFIHSQEIHETLPGSSRPKKRI